MGERRLSKKVQEQNLQINVLKAEAAITLKAINLW